MNPENALGMMIASAMEASAKKPQKTSQRTVTTSTEMPLEVADMRARRNTIGDTRTALADSLDARDSTRYRLGQALAGMPATRSGGINWGGGLANLGRSLNLKVDNDIDRMQQDYNNSRTDLADALLYDKAMGSQSTQVQDQTLGYDGGAGAAGAGMVAPDVIGQSRASKLADIYATITEKPNDFSVLGSARALVEPTVNARREYVATAMPDAVLDAFANLQTIMPNGFSRAVDTENEFKRIATEAKQLSTGRGSSIDSSIRSQLGRMYDRNAKAAAAAGLGSPSMSKNDWVSSVLGQGVPWNPKSVRNAAEPTTKTNRSPSKMNIPVGTVRNGIRYDGVDENGNAIYSRVQE